MLCSVIYSLAIERAIELLYISLELPFMNLGLRFALTLQLKSGLRVGLILVLRLGGVLVHHCSLYSRMCCSLYVFLIESLGLSLGVLFLRLGLTRGFKSD